MKRARLAVAGLVAPFLLTLAPGRAVAIAPTVSAWWNAGNTGAAATPAPPDVAAADLYVAGADPLSAVPAGTIPAGTVPVSGSQTAEAIIGLTFTFPATAQLDELALTLDPAATAPPAVSLMACRATSTFTAVLNGPYSAVPTYDADTCIAGALSTDKTAITFDGLGAFARSGSVSMVLVPGTADRDVFLPLTSSSLMVTEAPPPFVPSQGTVDDSSEIAAPVAPSAVTGGTTSGSTTTVGPGVTTGGSSVVAPLPAGSDPSAPAAQTQATLASDAGAGPISAAVKKLDSTTSRVLALLGLLALALFCLVGGLGGRLGIPLLAGRPSTTAPTAARGVGRFRSDRTGKAPRLS